MSEINIEESVERERDSAHVEDDVGYMDDDGYVDHDDTGFLEDDSLENDSLEDVGLKVDSVERQSFEVSEPERKQKVELDFPIDINVQLGMLAINTGNTMSMEKGDILKLETSCPGEVSLVFQGREVGRGKLVDVDGHLGVQITHNWCRS